MRTGRSDGEALTAAAREQDRSVADPSADHAAIRNGIECDSLREIGPFLFGLLGCHLALPWFRPLTHLRRLSNARLGIARL
jgi:hypothetical protein